LLNIAATATSAAVRATAGVAEEAEFQSYIADDGEPDEPVSAQSPWPIDWHWDEPEQPVDSYRQNSSLEPMLTEIWPEQPPKSNCGPDDSVAQAESEYDVTPYSAEPCVDMTYLTGMKVPMHVLKVELDTSVLLPVHTAELAYDHDSRLPLVSREAIDERVAAPPVVDDATHVPMEP